MTLHFIVLAALLLALGGAGIALAKGMDRIDARRERRRDRAAPQTPANTQPPG